MLIILLILSVNEYNHTNCVSLINQKCQIHPNKCSQQFHYYPFAVKLDTCIGNFNTLSDLSNKVCIWNKTEGLNLPVFDMITGIIHRKKFTFIYHVNVNIYLMEQNVNQINGGITTNVNMSVKNIIYVKKGLYLESCYM